MCVKNFSMAMNYQHISENNKIIIEKLYDLQTYENKFVTISYLLKNINMNLNEIYDSIYDLIDLNIIAVKEFSRCPNCLNDNIIKDENDLCKCNRCKKIYEKEYIIEKFRLINERIK